MRSPSPRQGLQRSSGSIAPSSLRSLCADEASMVMMLDRFLIGDLPVTLLFANVPSAGLQGALPCRLGVDRKERESFLQVGPLARRTRSLVRSAHQRLE